MSGSFLILLVECPLGCNRRYGIELIVLSVLVIDKVVAYLNLRAQGQLYLIPPLNGIKVEPELRLRLDDYVPVDHLVVPSVPITVEGAEAMGEGGTPHFGELPTVEWTKTTVMVCEVVLP